jgi:autotransporter-associated beta strand protein
MTSHRLNQRLLALTLPAGYFLTPLVATGQATWNGGTSTAWNTAANWSPGIPVDPSDIIISNTTTNGLTLDANHSVQSITFGTTGTRTSGFTLQTNTANTLTMNAGVIANGNFTGVGPTFRGNFNISQDQTFTIAGAAGDVTTDRGMFLRGPNDTAATVPSGAMAMNGNLTKEGSGQLSLLGLTISGAGNFVVNTGTLKLNGGGNQPNVIGGTGNITVNNSASLLFSRNSGSFNMTRPVILNDSASLVFGGGVDNTTIASNFTFNGAHALTVSRNFTLSGALTGSPTITRTGGSVLTLTGDTSLFTGTFSNNAGTLSVANNFGGGLQVGGGTVTIGGSLDGDANITAGTLTLNGAAAGNVNVLGGTAAVNGAVAGNLNASAATNLSGEITAAGNVDLTSVNLTVLPSTPNSLHAATDLVLTGTNTVLLQGDVPLATPFKVVSYDGFLSGDETNFTLSGGATAYRGFTFTNDTVGKKIDLSVNAGEVTWTGAISGNWDVNTTANWTGTSDKFFQVDAVTFPNVATTKFVTLTATVSPRSITFENETGSDYLISGTGTGFISGGASVTKNNTGVVILGGANGQNFTGPIAVNAGILRMGSRDAFGQSSGITVASGAQVDINGQAPGGVATGGYTYTIAGTGPSPANAGALVNTGVSVQSNAGVKSLVLSGNATIGGSGRIDIGSANLAGFGTITGNGHTLTVTNTDGVGFRGDASATPINIVANGGNIWAENTDNGFGGATGTVTVNTGAKAGTFGARSIATPITLNTGGTLHNQGGGTGTWTGSITLAGDTTAFDTNGQAIVISGTLGETGGSRILTKTGAGTLTLTSTAGNTGNTVITNGFLELGNGGTSGAINTNPVDIASATSGLIINRSDDTTLTNVISGLGPAANASNPGALSKNGTGTLTLTAANTYTGLTRLGAGMVAIGSNETVFGTGLIDFRNGGIRSSDTTPRTITNPLSYSNSTPFGSAETGDLLFTGPVATGGGAKTFFINNAVTEFSGVLSGTASTSTLTKAGPGTLIFSNDNSYLQTTTISEGILQVGNGGTTGNLSTTAVINNASLVINRSLAEGVLEFVFNNNVSGTGTITHSGPALTILGGDNTYTGDTIVTNGILSHTLPNFADGSSIFISTPGTLDLFHTETDTVAKLFIGGTPQAVGKWGRVGSIAALGADFETPLITGDGLLNVTSSGTATPFETWAADKGLTAANDDPSDNPDNDALDNLGEFAFDGDPLSGATGGKIVVQVASVGGQQVLTLTLPVRSAVGAFSGGTSLSATGDGVTYTIEAGDDLGPWTLDVDEVTGADATAIQAGLPALSGAGWVYRTFRSPGTVAGDPREFIRARVE